MSGSRALSVTLTDSKTYDVIPALPPPVTPRRVQHFFLHLRGDFQHVHYLQEDCMLNSEFCFNTHQL